MQFETTFAKEARNRMRLLGKTPRLFLRDTLGIAVCTKWQSGPTIGDNVAAELKGNR